MMYPGRRISTKSRANGRLFLVMVLFGTQYRAFVTVNLLLLLMCRQPSPFQGQPHRYCRYVSAACGTCPCRAQFEISLLWRFLAPRAGSREDVLYEDHDVSWLAATIAPAVWLQCRGLAWLDDPHLNAQARRLIAHGLPPRSWPIVCMYHYREIQIRACHFVMTWDNHDVTSLV